MHVNFPKARAGRTRAVPRERGATAVEYALMVGLVSVAIITSVVTLKDRMSTTIKRAAGKPYAVNAGAGTSTYGRVEMLLSDGQVFGNAHWNMGTRSAKDPLTGTYSGSSLTIIRDCSPWAGTPGCTQQWLLTKTAGTENYSGTYSEFSYTGTYATPALAPITLEAQ